MGVHPQTLNFTLHSLSKLSSPVLQTLTLPAGVGLADTERGGGRSKVFMIAFIVRCIDTDL